MFLNYKRLLVGTLLTVYKHFGIFSSAFLRFCCKFSMKIIFYLPVNTESSVKSDRSNWTLLMVH